MLEFLIAGLLGNILQEKEEPVPLRENTIIAGNETVPLFDETFLWLVKPSKNAPSATKYDFLH